MARAATSLQTSLQTNAKMDGELVTLMTNDRAQGGGLTTAKAVGGKTPNLQPFIQAKDQFIKKADFA